MDLTVTQLIKPVGISLSFSGPWLVTCDNKKRYILKFFDGHDNSLSNEFLGNKIAKAMDLTVPKMDVIYIGEDEVDVINASRNASNRPPVSAGRYFGSEFIENSYHMDDQIHRKLKTSQIKNIHEVPGMIVFDMFMTNIDRAKTNVLLHDLSGGQQIFEYVLIDHGSCFGGPIWDFDRIKNLQLDLHQIHWKHNFFPSIKEFKVYVEKLQSLDKKFFKEITDEIPAEWNKKPETYDTLLTALDTRNISEILSLVKKNKQDLIVRNLRKRVPPIHGILDLIDNIKASGNAKPNNSKAV